MELLSPMVGMLEGLGFNLCVVPFLNVCVPNLPQGQGQTLSEVVRVGLEVLYWDGRGETNSEEIVRMKTSEDSQGSKHNI